MFSKGRSGNPNGRPKGTTKYSELGKYINEKTHNLKDVVNTVVSICKNAKADGTKIMAAEWLRDSTLGKPRQAIDVTDERTLRIEDLIQAIEESNKERGLNG